MSSSLVTRYDTTPNMETAGCMLTGEPGPGVVLNHIRTLTNEFVFIGDAAVTEAFAEVSGLTVAQLNKLVKATATADSYKDETKRLKAELAKWEAFADRMESAGLVIRELE